MLSRTLLFLAIPFWAAAEVHELTLARAVEIALEKNPDVILAQLDEAKAQQQVRVVKDPFSPKIGVGSGLAYSSGFPMSIEGSAPSIIQARASQFIINRQQSYLVAQAKENARGAGFDTAAKREEVAWRTASLYLDAEKAARLTEASARQIESLEKILETLRVRVKEGRELPIVEKRAALNVAVARQNALAAQQDRDFAERTLAAVLGFGAEDRVRPAAVERAAPELPPSEDAAADRAVRSSKELRALESRVIAAGLEVRAAKASRLPRVDLVAQYGLFAKFNNYEDFFRRFQRHNGQLGVSFQLPLSPGPGAAAQAAQAEAESTRLRTRINALRNQLSLDARQAFQRVRTAESSREVARLSLDVAREQVSVNLALFEEGRLPLRELEQSRFQESEQWMASVNSQYALERARLELLRHTGELVAAVR